MFDDEEGVTKDVKDWNEARFLITNTHFTMASVIRLITKSSVFKGILRGIS